MQVSVTRCWGGCDHYYWRLEAKGKERLELPTPGKFSWDRHTATLALNAVQHNWGVDRKKVRFV